MFLECWISIFKVCGADCIWQIHAKSLEHVFESFWLFIRDRSKMHNFSWIYIAFINGNRNDVISKLFVWLVWLAWNNTIFLKFFPCTGTKETNTSVLLLKPLNELVLGRSSRGNYAKSWNNGRTLRGSIWRNHNTLPAAISSANNWRAWSHCRACPHSFMQTPREFLGTEAVDIFDMDWYGPMVMIWCTSDNAT